MVLSKHANMNRIIALYVLLLVFFSSVMLIFILVGSHGKLILANNETLKYVFVAMIYIATAVLSIITARSRIKNRLIDILMVVLHITTAILVCYQINLLMPQFFTLLSAFVLGLHFIGLMVTLLIIYRSLVNIYRGVY